LEQQKAYIREKFSDDETGKVYAKEKMMQNQYLDY